MQRVIATTVILMSTLPAKSSDWPTFAHDNRRSYVTDAIVKPPLHLQWVYESPSRPAPGWSRPVNGYGARKTKSNVSYDDSHPAIVIGETVYFCSSAENCLYAVDAGSGQVRWRFFTDAAPRLAPTFSDGRLFFGADDGRVYCLNAMDGSVVWQLNAALNLERMLGYGRFSSVWPIRTSVTVENGIAYFTSGLFPSEGVFFFAVSADDGKILWRREIGRLTGNVAHANLAPQGYTLIGNDSIYLTSRVSPARFRKADGEYVPFATPFPEVPKSHEYRFYNGGDYAQLWNDRQIVFGRACLLGYDPDGEWTNRYRKTEYGQLKFHWFNARQIVRSEATVYVSTDTHLLAINETELADISDKECREFEELYKKLRVADRLDAMEEYDGIVAEYGEDHPLAVKLRDGSLRYSQRAWDQWQQLSPAVFEKFEKRCRWMLPLSATESLILAGTTLFAGGDTDIHAINANSGQHIWSDLTGSRVRAISAVDERLLVSTTDGSVRCYSQSAGQTGPVLIGDATRSTAADVTVSPGIRELSDLILSQYNLDRGHAVVLGGDGNLAFELARRSRLSIEVLASPETNLTVVRNRLAEAGLYGGRITASRLEKPKLSFPPYIFNLVIDLTMPDDGVSVADALKLTRPLGGVAVFPNKAVDTAAIPDNSFTRLPDANLLMFRRGAIPGTKDWTHNYAVAGNTYSSEDTQVKGPFGILWYGEPGPRQRIDRHASAPMPLVAKGVLFTIGYERVMAFDVYNGVKYWERRIAGATRTSLPMGTSNIAADGSGLFIVINDSECRHLDAISGETLRTFTPPARDDDSRPFWGWLARHGEFLFGSRALPGRVKVRPDQKHSDELFALKVASGKLAWRKPVGRVEHDGVAISGNLLFYVDQVLTPAEQMIARKTLGHGDASVPSRPLLDRRGKPIEPDLRKLVALDSTTGTERWSVPFNATDVTLDDNAVLDGRSGVSCMVKDGVVVVHGVGSVGHPHREFLAGEFARRALYVFSCEDGRFLWGGRKGYRKRPIIAGEYIYAEPFAWNLKTGQQKTILNPLSGEPQPFDFHRGYIGCSHLLASGSTLFGNKNGIGYCNLDSTEGFSSFRSLSLACGLGATPANGVFVAPEGRSGCTCSGSGIHTSVTLYPREYARDWAVGVSGGIATAKTFPVKHAFINLGAPGYREDQQKRLWIPYPPTRDDGITGTWLSRYHHSPNMFYRVTGGNLDVKENDPPWLFTSGYHNEKPLTFKLQEPDQPEATYAVTLYFAEHDNLKPAQRIFTVSIQNKPVLPRFDVASQAATTARAVIRSFRGIAVKESLVISLKPESDSDHPPILSAIGIERE